MSEAEDDVSETGDDESEAEDDKEVRVVPHHRHSRPPPSFPRKRE